MSLTSRPLVAAGVAVATCSLAALAGTGLAASAVSTSAAGTPSPTCTPSPTATLAAGTVVQADTLESGKPAAAWALGDGQTLDVTADAAHQGAWGLRIDGLQSKPLSYHVTTTSTKGTYRVQLWLRTSPQVPTYLKPYLDLVATDDASGQSLASQSVTIGPDWTQVSLLVTPAVSGSGCSFGAALPFTVALRAWAPGCGSAPVLALDLDDVAVTYAGTVVPTSTAAAPARVAPACVVPTWTTTTTSTSTRPTTSTAAKPACRVRTSTVLSWPGGVQVRLVVSNLTGAPRTGWHLRAAAPAGEALGYAWPAAATQADGVITLSASGDYADPLPSRRPVEFGLVLTGGSTPPSGWTLDGLACKAG